MWSVSLSWKRVLSLIRGEELTGSVALMEMRMYLTALILEYESWEGVPDTPGKWDDEMKPFDASLIHTTGGKCVLKLKPREKVG